MSLCSQFFDGILARASSRFYHDDEELIDRLLVSMRPLAKPNENPASLV
jgi:hypothetical protein